VLYRQDCSRSLMVKGSRRITGVEVIVGEALPVPKRLDVVLGLVGRRCVSAAGFLPRCKTYGMYAFS